MKQLRRYYKLYLALGVACAAGMLWLLGRPQYAPYVIGIYCAAIALLLCVGMVRDIMRGKYGVDILAVIAIVSTLWVGEYWASIVIVLMMLGGEALETYANTKARAELASLLDRAPAIAHKKSTKGTVTDVPIDTIQIGDIIVVQPGEMIPIDGTVKSGESTLDESSITGESLPIEVKKGVEVLSGAVNGEAPLTICATRTASDSQYSQIVSLVREASQVQAPFVRMADRYAVPFTAISLAIAGLGWWMSGDPRRFAEVLVVATPCPLLLAAPVAFIGGMSRAAHRGIIVKNGGVIERMSRIRAVAFDKTGTLTTGKLSVDTIIPAKGFNAIDVLAYAAGVEQHSVHVTAIAVAAAAKLRRIRPIEVSDVTEHPGHGMSCKVEGKELRVGKHEFALAHVKNKDDVPVQAAMASYVALGTRYVGVIIYGDTLRPDSEPTIAALQSLGVERFVMVTGDQQAPAEAVADRVGITDINYGCLPADKVRIVRDFTPRPIMMVGDGVNDAPVLAASDVGVAMGARGATAASESADVVIMLDEISRVPMAVEIAKSTVSVARVSVLLGIGMSIALMCVAVWGVIPAIIGALLQEAVDVSVIIYALRARRGKLLTDKITTS